MTHNRMLDRAPSCAILHNRNELKVYQDNQVYLNDGDNFELRFFNPTNFKIGVEIVFNGLKKGDGYLVLNPGQDLILDRFLDEQRKAEELTIKNMFDVWIVDGVSRKDGNKYIKQTFSKYIIPAIGEIEVRKLGYQDLLKIYKILVKCFVKTYNE